MKEENVKLGMKVEITAALPRWRPRGLKGHVIGTGKGPNGSVFIVIHTDGSLKDYHSDELEEIKGEVSCQKDRQM